MTERQLQKWFKEHIKDGNTPYTLDKDQAKIVLDAHKNTLVTARAGSGKTRTIVAKIIFLLTHAKIKPEEIIVFAFNRKAALEINQRLTKISFNNSQIFMAPPSIATTFHAFAYQLLGGKKALQDKIITENQITQILDHLKIPVDFRPTFMQFVNRVEQQFFQDYNKLFHKISRVENDTIREELQALAEHFKKYKKVLQEKDLISFNELISNTTTKPLAPTPYKYIFIDEYQDFSLLFQTLITTLRASCPDAHLLAVGDDWQAINRFAGSDVNFFLNFGHFFPEDSKQLFVPTNYRSGKRIVQNANFFMSKAVKDYKGCKSGNKIKSSIYLINTNRFKTSARPEIPYQIQKYIEIIKIIIQENPNKSIKILSRNNNLSVANWSIERIMQEFFPNNNNLSCSTIHRSKGLEADVVVLLEIDDDKFPGKDKSGNLFQIFGDSKKTHFEDEVRLFYVALTRPKEKLYILSKTTKITKENKDTNFFAFMNENYLNPLF